MSQLGLYQFIYTPITTIIIVVANTIKIYFKRTSLLMSLLALSACSNIKQETVVVSQQSNESPYCTSVATYSPSIQINGTAQFEYRPMNTSLGLNGNPQIDTIAFAEVVVKDSNGNTVQCAETQADGSISFNLPKLSGSYTLQINSRAHNQKLKASVIEDYYVNQPYNLELSFSTASTDTVKNVGTVVARARESESSKVLGGAFNILKQFYLANKYIRESINDNNFVAPKVVAYWKKGHNPYTYFGGSSLISFYRTGTSQLFILGGSNGDVKSSDTDHFDNSVIIHEYGHFLEDIYAKSESPGGSHNGNFIIDPRLAWSEGWANFLQAAVIRSNSSTWKFYLDSIGFSGDSVEGGSGGLGIKVDLTMAGSTGKCHSGSANNTCDPVNTNGEGTFREMSVSRFLFKTIIATVDGGVAIPFKNLWNAFTFNESGGIPQGLGSNSVNFKNIGLFNKFLRNQININNNSLLADWDNLLPTERQNSSTKDYADTLVVQANNSCTQKTLSPTVDLTYPGTGEKKSNQLTSNDFYEYVHDGQSKIISLEYTGGSSTLDLDLFIYNTSYKFQESATTSNGSILASSARINAIDNGTESIDFTNLAAGKYLINVKAYTYGRTPAQLSGSMLYRLKKIQNSTTEDLCPSN